VEERERGRGRGVDKGESGVSVRLDKGESDVSVRLPWYATRKGEEN